MDGSGGGEGAGHQRKKKIKPLLEQKLSPGFLLEPDLPDHYIEPPPWYNTTMPFTRWKIASHKAQLVCPKDPKGQSCQEYVELLLDCPKDLLDDAMDLPPLTDPSKPVNDPPLQLADRCKLWKWWHNKCREYNQMNGEWKCIPFESFVEEHCPSDWRCTKKAPTPWEGVGPWLWSYI